MNSIVNMNNPWAGLSSYKDPEDADVKLKFCGRDDESYDVANLIDNNIFVTLYGRSGTGKTSLLNAGVFPRLRHQGYLPVSIRLGMDAIGLSFQQCIISDVEKVFWEKGSFQVIDSVSMPDDIESTEYLWAYFARRRFYDKDGRVIFPVIVLDQFEEVLRNRRKDVDVLLRQIYFLMDERHALSNREIEGKFYSYDYNFRFVVSIREDDLYRLEDCIDNNYLLSMKLCRFRLRNLSKNGAKDVILIPGDGLFLPEERDKVAKVIIDEVVRKQQDGSISTNILSLVCSRLFIESQQSGMNNIPLSLVDKFVKGNPYEKFYKEATRNLSNRERSYIEENLVDSKGRRNSVPESDFQLHVKKYASLLEGEKRILQRTSSSSDGGYCRIELIHDSFCDYLANLKKKREKTKKMRFWAIVMAISVVYVIAGAYLWHQNDVINQKNSQLKRAVSKIKKGEHEMAKLRQRWSYVEDSLNNRMNLLLTVSGISKVDVFYETDHIRFQYEDPTLKQLLEWKEKNADKCRSLVQGKTKGYTISENMMKNDPCIVYLILKSKSLDSSHEKQSWFDLYNLMNEKQLSELYRILYRETYKLSEIETRYNIKREKLERERRNKEYLDKQKQQTAQEKGSPQIPDFGDLKDEDFRFE